MGDRVDVQIDGGVARVRLERPDRHNALDMPMFGAIEAARTSVAADPEVRAVVLSGSGPSFCSGLDVGALAAGELEFDALVGRPEDEDANLAQRVAYGWREVPVPVIAALHGACFGGGLQIALGADIRIAAPGTRLSIMEIKVGLVPDMGITQALPRLCREDVARELTYTGRIVEAEEAVALGLVTRVAEDPVAAAEELAAEIAEKSPAAIRGAKKVLTEAWAVGPGEGLRLETATVKSLLAGAGS